MIIDSIDWVQFIAALIGTVLTVWMRHDAMGDLLYALSKRVNGHTRLILLGRVRSENIRLVINVGLTVVGALTILIRPQIPEVLITNEPFRIITSSRSAAMMWVTAFLALQSISDRWDRNTAEHITEKERIENAIP